MSGYSRAYKPGLRHRIVQREVALTVCTKVGSATPRRLVRRTTVNRPGFPEALFLRCGHGKSKIRTGGSAAGGPLASGAPSGPPVPLVDHRIDPAEDRLSGGDPPGMRAPGQQVDANDMTRAQF